MRQDTFVASRVGLVPKFPAVVPRRVQVWYTLELRASAPDLLILYSSWLSPDESELVRRKPTQRLRVEYLVSHGLTRSVLSACTGVPPSSLPFNRDENGRPCLDRSDAGSVPDFNLSHTCGLSGLAVANGATVGIDVENLQRSVNPELIMRNFFSDPERQHVLAVTASEQQRRFLEIWTLKEAWAKCLGLGLTAPFRKTCFLGVDEGSIHAGLPDIPGYAEEFWTFRQFTIRDNFVLAIAARSSLGSFYIQEPIEIVPGSQDALTD